MIKTSYKINKFADTLKYYQELLPYIKTAVTRNYSEKSINNILDFVSNSQDMTFLRSFYSTTLQALEDAKNERLWTKTNLKLAKVLLDRREFHSLTQILSKLHQSCQNTDGSDDQKKGYSSVGNFCTGNSNVYRNKK